MPHIIVKLYPGRSEEQKKQLAREIAKKVTKIAVCEEKSVSVAFEEVARGDWAEKVYRPDIIDNEEKLIVAPGYNPFQNKDEIPAAAGDGSEFRIRSYQAADESAVIDLWHRCNLVVPQNDPKKDIKMKLKVQPELFFVGVISSRIVSTVMSGYDGHRGWLYYLAVDPDFQQNGIGRRMVEKAEKELRKLGCRKINLQVRNSNKSMIAFYEHIGFGNDDVLGMGKKL